ncbi:hypothetical protein PD5205_02254 [Xanthomonas fragariae]|uniref:Uncharacterized protein n=1 Tax=Xanthomonas fragariae TaxID=48664 RepID=A0A1Y6HAF7_9XANT|nr:hypothetical protein NBC2815_02243 [Xanthomonas fragariae]SMQ99521.1 hypothetical protein PD885_02280 [Xanthomonas fragariae]SMR03554.1 hypothetical protein PD5205_02254 [Xanthomonas fragariae]
MQCKYPRRSTITVRRRDVDRTMRRCGRTIAQVHVFIGPYMIFVSA